MLILALVIFLGVHSARIVANGWRTASIARVGEKRWKGLYTLLSIVGFVLLACGYGQARQLPGLWWSAPPGMRYVTSLLMLAVKLWSFARLLSSGTPADVRPLG